MASLNKVMVIGNLGKDPDIRSTGSGKKVANFSVAVTEKFTGRDGQKQERTEWVSVVAWDKLAEVAEKYLQKGSSVFVEGSLSTRTWDDAQTGEKKYRTEVQCRNLQMLGSRGEKPQEDAPQMDAAPDDLPF